MIIKSITIEGWKSIRKLTVPLTKLNVLIGSNGVGKSNFIQLFSFLRAIYEQDLQGYILRKGGADRLLYFGKKNTQTITLSLDFTYPDAPAEPINTYEVLLEVAQDDLYIKQTKTVFYNQVGAYPSIQERNVRESTIQEQSHGQLFWINQYLKQYAIYHFHDTSDTSPMKQLQAVDDHRQLHSDGSNIAAFLYHLQQHHPRHFKRIQKTIQSIAPFFQRFRLQPSAGNQQHIKLEWHEKGNYEGYFDAYSLSDGTLRFICLVTLLLQPSPPEIIIIDEPELGLHPLAIEVLAELLQRLGEDDRTQLIISTQSTDLINCMEPEHILVADREQQQTVIKRLDEQQLEEWLNTYSLGEIWQKNIIGGQPF